VHRLQRPTASTFTSTSCLTSTGTRFAVPGRTTPTGSRPSPTGRRILLRGIRPRQFVKTAFHNALDLSLIRCWANAKSHPCTPVTRPDAHQVFSDSARLSAADRASLLRRLDQLCEDSLCTTGAGIKESARQIRRGFCHLSQNAFTVDPFWNSQECNIPLTEVSQGADRIVRTVRFIPFFGHDRRGFASEHRFDERGFVREVAVQCGSRDSRSGYDFVHGRRVGAAAK